MIKPGGELRFTVRGTSMLPTLSPGDTVRVNPDRSPGLNDLVCFRLPLMPETFIHRVVAIKGAKFLTCGDNRLLPDRILSQENILGVVESLENSGLPLPPEKSPGLRLLRALLIYLKLHLSGKRLGIRLTR